MHSPMMPVAEPGQDGGELEEEATIDLPKNVIKGSAHGSVSVVVFYQLQRPNPQRSQHVLIRGLGIGQLCQNLNDSGDNVQLGGPNKNRVELNNDHVLVYIPEVGRSRRATRQKQNTPTPVLQVELDVVIMFNKVYSKAQHISISPYLNTHERMK
ncbi:hypothetical protein fugu_010751 [Takifugu bimaculatus]|uniref:Uncharacterized protein n=1 Tax=Takifugu bimaculatus TaxID=433685 RepID=A0A4Z2CB11_9TELE|nr:hypothetical protein fugu_010751 [Takifugu bimaculatus]